MNHPFFALTSGQRRWWFVALLLLTALVMVVMRSVDRPLQTTAAPQGIVSFELAGNAAAAQAMIDSWDARARSFAGFSLGFDYVFMLLYAATIALACVGAANLIRGKNPGWATWGAALAWGQGLAALLDAVENAALWRMLSTGLAAMPWPAVARWCATGKFALLGLGLLFVAAAWVFRLRSPVRS